MSTRSTIFISVEAENSEALQVITSIAEELKKNDFPGDMTVGKKALSIVFFHSMDIIVKATEGVSQQHPTIEIDMEYIGSGYNSCENKWKIKNGCWIHTHTIDCYPDTNEYEETFYGSDGKIQRRILHCNEYICGELNERTVEFNGDECEYYFCNRWPCNSIFEVYSSDLEVLSEILRNVCESYYYHHINYVLDEKSNRLYFSNAWIHCFDFKIEDVQRKYPNARIVWSAKYVFDKEVIDEESGVSQSYMVQAFEPEQEIEKRLQFVYDKQKEQPLPVCPRCGRATMEKYNALSRGVQIDICPACGIEEAINASTYKPENITDWYAVRYFDDWKLKNVLR